MKIKIAVATGFEEGKPTWQAFGFSSAEAWGEAMESFNVLDGEQKFWITAEVPDPVEQIPEIAGEVETPAEEAA